MFRETLSSRLHRKTFALFVLAVTAAAPKARSAENDADNSTVGPLPGTQFVNPIAEGADPWVTRDESSLKYYWCMSEGNRAIAVHASDSITSLGPKQIVWNAPETGPVSREVWAPELHRIDNRWFIYFAASDGQNKNHRAYVLASRTADPLGEYDLHGPLATGDSANENRWAIDMTVLEHGSKRYAIWSGWDTKTSDRQYLYIAEMESPTKLATLRTRICDNNDFPWEFTEGNGKGRGLNEGPQILKSSGRTFVTFSCGGSWLPTYRLGMLELIGENPLDPKAWKKYSEPVFQSTTETFGVGHSCFVPSPDERESWHVFHAKMDTRPGWRRAIYVEPFQFSDDGLPKFGQPRGANTPLALPSGTSPPMELSLPYRSNLRTDHNYYGHHQFYRSTDTGLLLGKPPSAPINDYRSGEKIVLRGSTPNNFTASVVIDFQGNDRSRDAGILLRVTAPAVGFDAQRGYFVGIKPVENALLFGRMDGVRWTELKRVPCVVDTDRETELQVTAVGSEFKVHVNGKPVLNCNDDTYPTGAVGLRVVNTAAIFRDFRVETTP